MKIDTVFQILAVALAMVAAYFLWVGNKDGAFVSVVLGCVAFFISIRFQAKARTAANDPEREVLIERRASAREETER
jgi:hypothetical protein